MDTVGNLSFTPDHNPASSIPWKIQWIGGIGFIGLLTFTWLPNSYAYMVAWPYILIWQSAFLILLAYTVWLCRRFSIPFQRLGYGLDHIVVLLMVTSALSTATSQFREVAFWNFLLIANYVICLYFLVNWLRQGSLTRFSLWMLLSSAGLVTSIISLAMWRPNASMWLSDSFSAAVRNGQPLGHHNFVGGYELLVFPLVASFSLSQAGWRKQVGSVATIIVAIALYASGSRGALFGMLSLGIIAVGLGLILSRRQNRRQWAKAGIAFTLVISLALISNPRVRNLFSLRPAVDADSISFVSISDGPTKDRIFMIESAWNILKEHPILGVGPGNLSRVYNIYRPLDAGTGLNLVQQLHNTPAQIAAELGILGLVVYFALLSNFLRLGILLHSRIAEQRDRVLLYGIGASWLGYSISSLSDYQLENTGITTTLIATTALLISLIDTHCKPQHGTQTDSHTLSRRSRRISSLCLLALLCANLQLWARVDASLYLAHSAIQNVDELNFVGADAKWAKASQLVPWDPTYPALAAEAVLKLIEGVESEEEDTKELRSLAIAYFEDALEAAPNDPWFNQNLATLLLENGEAEAAEFYAKQAISLSPRNDNNYTYYTLGMSLLAQEKVSEALDAFVLEAIANPIFLTADVWEQESLAKLKDIVIEQTLNSYRLVLSQTNEISNQYRWLHEQLAILSWWYQYPLNGVRQENLRPLVQAILISEIDSQKALSLIDEHIEHHGRSNDLHLLQARLSPDQYLPELLEKLAGTDEEEAEFAESLRAEETMQSWLSKVKVVAEGQLRYGNVFAYRNLAANNIQKILHPGKIQTNVLPSSIGLFSDAPREYPQLDRYMASVRTDKLTPD